MPLRSLLLACSALLVLAPPALAQSAGATGATAAPAAPPARTASATSAPAPGTAVLVDGVAHAPAGAPPAVRRAIAAANRIVGKPYRYGGGHARAQDTGYDCSGTVSFALAGAGLLGAPLDSGALGRWGEAGRGRWITVFTNPGHAYVVIAGLRLDTSAAGDPGGGRGPRWRPVPRSAAGFTARHPAGL
jgi:hypothetical protein